MALALDEVGEYNDTRLFFVTESSEDNEEIFETLEDAREYVEATKFQGEPEIWISIVKNAYREENGEWNYEDYSNTFEKVRRVQ